MQENIGRIRTYGDPVLRRRATSVRAVDDEIRRICEDMVEAMIRENGLGLAAPQIGVAKRIFVLDVEGEIHVFINPDLVERSEESEDVREGCLSVPGVDAPVPRARRVVVEGLDLQGNRIRLEGEGLLARAIQHEMDHLNGHLFVDRLSSAKRQSVLREYQRARRDKEAQ